MFWKREPRELLYFPLTAEDLRARRGLRYRIGHLLRGRGIGLVLIASVGPPLGLIFDLLDDGRLTESSAGAVAVLAVVWVIGLIGMWGWVGYLRQDWSERRRALRLTPVTEDDDQEVTDAKRVLLDHDSTEAGREQAVVVLRSRGECVPYEFSVGREVLEGALAAVVVLVIFVLAVWIFD